MPKSSELEFSHLREMPRYSAAMRSALTLSAVVITLLPVPVTYFEILPTYQVQGTFLLFYAPFFCLLTLCYLFYIRDSLARAMFADVLDPAPPPDPYYQEPFGQRLSRRLRRVKAMVLGILPALLVIASLYCVSRYLGAITQSRTAPFQSAIRTSRMPTTITRTSSPATKHPRPPS